VTRKQSTKQEQNEIVETTETESAEEILEQAVTDGEVDDPNEMTDEEVAELEAEVYFSPYKATDHVNDHLRVSGLLDKDGNAKRLPAQMIYRYVQDGRIKASKNDQGKWQISLTDLAEWLLAYTDKQLTLQAKKAATTTEVVESTETVDEFEEDKELEPAEA
jgi:hypothetical protein